MAQWSIGQGGYEQDGGEQDWALYYVDDNPIGILSQFSQASYICTKYEFCEIDTKKRIATADFHLDSYDSV